MSEKKDHQYFCKQRDGGGCGLCAINTILRMFGLPALIFAYDPKTGISPRKITSELDKEGFATEIKDRISTRYLKRFVLAILWYPPGGKNKNGGHYVVFGGIDGNRAKIYDSDNNGLEWLSFSALEKKWYRLYKKRRCGWAIVVRRKSNI